MPTVCMYDPLADRLLLRKPQEDSHPYLIADCRTDDFLQVARRDTLTLLLVGSAALAFASAACTLSH